MDKSEVANLVGSLKGAPVSVVLALFLLGRPASLQELGAITRYSPPTLRAGLDRLALLRFVQEERACGQFTLTTRACQLVLGETGLALESAPLALEVADSPALAEEKKFFPHVSHVSNLPLSGEENDIHNVQKAEKILFDADAEEAVQWLIDLGRWETTPNGKGARDSVGTALGKGMTGAECFDYILAYTRYARTKAGARVRDVGAYAAYGLREGMPVPHYELDRNDPDYWEWCKERRNDDGKSS